MTKKTVLLFLLVLTAALAGLSGTALASPDKNFLVMNSPTSKNLNAVWGMAADNVYAVGDDGVILHYDGTGWTSMSSGTTATLKAIWGTSNINIFAVGYDYADVGGIGTFTGKILRYDGTSWSTMETIPDIGFSGVGGVGSYVYACGQDHSIDRGVIYLKEGWDWTRKYTSNTAKSYQDIWGYQPEGSQHKFTYFAGDSEVVEYRPELITPDKVLISGNYPFTGIWGSVSSTGWDFVAVGGNPDYDNTYGDIRLYDFTTKNHIMTTYTVFLFDVWGVSNTDVYAVGGVMDRGRIIHYDGTGWEDAMVSTIYFLGVWGSSSTDFFVVGGGGTILRLNTGPDKPSNILPANGATNVSLTPALQSSAFADPNPGDTHAASHWQITSTPGSYSSPVYDSGTDTANKLSLTVPGGTLAGNTVYYWRVRYQDNNGAWSDWSNSKSFTTLVPAPTITSIYPVSAAPGDTVSVVIAGENLNGATGLGFPGILIENFTVDSPTQITAVLNVPPDAIDGPVDVSVNTPGGMATLADGFFVEPTLGPPIEVPAPAIDSLDPDSSAPGDEISISITGSNFNGATEVDFGQGIDVENFTVDNASRVTADIDIDPDAAAGTRDVSVTTPGGVATLADGFTVEEVLLPPPVPDQENQTQDHTGQGTDQGDQTQTGQQTQDQGQPQDITVQQRERVRNITQEREREMNQSLQSLPQWQQNVYQNQNQVRLAVHVLLAMENLTGGIGRNVSRIAREFNNSVQATIRAEEMILARNQLVRFFMGGDQEAAQEILNETSTNQLRIEQLKQLRLECNCSEEIKAMMQEQIENMEQEQARLQQLSLNEMQNKGLFGWLFGWLSGV